METMKNIYFSVMRVLPLAALLLCSCAKETAIEGIVDDASLKGTLSVGTRSGSDIEVSLPVNIYVFGTSGACTACTELNSTSDKVSIYLPIGTYNVYAIGGADEDNYVLPTKDNAKSDFAVTLRNGKSHGDLMTAAQALVRIGEGEENTLTLSMTRKVMQILSVKMLSVPTDVTAVSVSISPLYSALCLDGNYSGTGGSVTVDLTKGDDGTTWSATPNEYLLEPNGSAAVTVAMTTASVTKIYSYSSVEELKANYKINITGTYKTSGFTVSGTVSGAEWAGTREIAFDMAESGESGTTQEQGQQTTTTASAPKVGTIYKDSCYVVSNDTNSVDGSITSTLMTVKDLGNLVDDGATQAECEAAVASGIATLAVDGIDGWRLPTHSEIMEILVYIKSLSSTKSFANLLVNAGGSNMSASSSYFYRDDDGKVMKISGTDVPESPNSSTHLRAFTTLTFK